MKNIRKIVTYPKTLSGLAVFQKYRKVAVYARVSTSSEEQLNSMEAQKKYYLKLISEKPEWEFSGLYSDEGVSGVSQKHRDGFNKMMADAELGKFNLIITKSISRFARNTVDSLVSIRKLKTMGVEVYFQKEDLWTFDSTGEFMLTLLSSMAQEESRSISENVTWGQRKRFADGKYTMPFEQFLGYDRGKNGAPIVNEKEAVIVKLIFRLFLHGKTPVAIVNYLNSSEIPTPSGKKKWSQTVVVSILSNEKYKGDALMQKKFTVDYLCKKTKRNEGELPQYYVKNGHKAIIPRATFDYTQEVIAKRREEYTRQYSSTHALSSKIQCGDCGSYYGRKNSHFETSGRHDWFCNNRYKGQTCHSPRVREDYLEQIYNGVILSLLQSRQELFPYFIELISKLNLGEERTAEIKGFLENIQVNPIATIAISDDFLCIAIEKIHATADSHLVFEFINGETFDVVFDRKAMERHSIPHIEKKTALYLLKRF